MSSRIATLPTIAEIAAITPAPWVQEGDTLVARWGERPAETVLTVRRSATFDLILVEATLDCYGGSSAADYPDELPRALRMAYTNAVLGVQASGAGLEILKGVPTAPAWLRAAILPTIRGEIADHVRAINETEARLHRLVAERCILEAQLTTLFEMENAP